jgi:hypothetical protein
MLWSNRTVNQNKLKTHKGDAPGKTGIKMGELRVEICPKAPTTAELPVSRLTRQEERSY